MIQASSWHGTSGEAGWGGRSSENTIRPTPRIASQLSFHLCLKNTILIKTYFFYPIHVCALLYSYVGCCCSTGNVQIALNCFGKAQWDHRQFRVKENSLLFGSSDNSRLPFSCLKTQQWTLYTVAFGHGITYAIMIQIFLVPHCISGVWDTVYFNMCIHMWS